MINPRMRVKLKLRDPYCMHCGETDDLVVHHRKNRGMGGSKLLDHYPNLMMICSDWNGRMESYGENQEDARRWGHKLASWQDFSEPVHDRCDGLWYRLEEDGTKTVVDHVEEGLI